jgi:hypothetical protein
MLPVAFSSVGPHFYLRKMNGRAFYGKAAQFWASHFCFGERS